MKTAFRISIAINCAAIGAVVFLATQKPKVILRTVPTPGSEANSRSTQVADSTMQSVKAEPFCWAQLESTDYKVYIANLRGVGCPDQTIRDIIVADVDAAIFAPRREQLKQFQNARAAGLEAGLQALGAEESTFIAGLLGTQLNAGEAAASTPAPSRLLRKKSPDAPIALPVVFQNADLAGLKLSANQLAEMEELRKNFVEQIGGTNQDPNDPAYRERWQKAQPAINDQLEAVLGRAAYQTLQFEAQSAALSQPAADSKP